MEGKDSKFVEREHGKVCNLGKKEEKFLLSDINDNLLLLGIVKSVHCLDSLQHQIAEEESEEQGEGRDNA